jgi:uncharacterized repeat protein (TIGR02543 family)
LLFGCAIGPKSYTITFYLNGGKGETKLKYNELSTTFYLQIPDKYEHKFVGWYLDSTFESEKIKKVDNGSKGNMKLYAKWTPYVENVVFQELEYTTLTENIYLGKYPQEIVPGNYNDILDKLTPDEKGIYHIDDLEIVKASESYYYYSFIKWKVVHEDADKYTLLSDKALDFQTFDANNELYENSFIRGFLNNEFYQRSFNEESKELIIGTILPENNVTDNVYLPSFNEYQSMDRGVTIPIMRTVPSRNLTYSTSYSYILQSEYIKSDSKKLWIPVQEYFWTRSSFEEDSNSVYAAHGGEYKSFSKDIPLFVRACINIRKK